LLINVTDKLEPDQLGWGHAVGVPMLTKAPHVNRLFKNVPQQQIRNIFVLVTPEIVGRQD
jgi:hypothetical protein